jgi:hypothetical protein
VKKNQLRCCQRIGEPPSPASKKTPSKWRSMSSIVSAAIITAPLTARR